MRAIVAGATGLVGGELINLLAPDSRFTSVTVWARRRLELDGKFNLTQASLDEAEFPPADVAFCALGTTIGKAGSQSAFYAVDHDLVISFAEKAKTAGVHNFVLVSSIGADARSANFYLKVKGQTENDLKSIGFNQLTILRPSMLLGDRKEFRFGELIGKGVISVVNPLMLGPLKKYRGVNAKEVAQKMISVCFEERAGVRVYEF
jgi:uncharacterized protein YbjT (DUF2867 family)